MSDSSLVEYKNLTKNCSSRTEKISKITIHHAAGIATARALVDSFLPAGRLASANYCIGNDGMIGQSVPEGSRAWTSSSNWNDQRAVTIEVSNSINKEPWAVSDAAYCALLDLCVDICQRNGIRAVSYDGTKNGVLTEHRMFAATACPGTTLHALLTDGTIPAAINRRLEKGAEMPDVAFYKQGGVDYSVVFDSGYYGAKYADLGRAGLKAPAQLFQHFLLFGMREARQGCAAFSPVAYRAHNPDLQAAFDDDWEAYYRHYILCGRAEVASGARAEFM